MIEKKPGRGREVTKWRRAEMQEVTPLQIKTEQISGLKRNGFDRMEPEA